MCVYNMHNIYIYKTIYIYVYALRTHTYTYTHIYICIHVCVCVSHVCKDVKLRSLVIFTFRYIILYCSGPSGAQWAGGQRGRPPGPVQTYLRDAPGWHTRWGHSWWSHYIFIAVALYLQCLLWL